MGQIENTRAELNIILLVITSNINSLYTPIQRKNCYTEYKFKSQLNAAHYI
jgi:hypothetical protein